VEVEEDDVGARGVRVAIALVEEIERVGAVLMTATVSVASVASNESTNREAASGSLSTSRTSNGPRFPREVVPATIAIPVGDGGYLWW